MDHHDRAYQWAERRKLQTHPTTGAAQFVEIREAVQQVLIPRFVEAEQPRQAPDRVALFVGVPDEELLGYGVPPEWLVDVRSATENTLLGLTDHLPSEAAEALLELATGGKPRPVQPPIVAANPFDHPYAQRRFRLVANVEELQRALDYPWEKWTVFLHPEQRHVVGRDYGGPARVAGSAGTGKTIVGAERFAASGEWAGRLAALALVMVLGALAYGALFTLVGLVFSRPALVGLFLAFGWESAIPFLPGWIRHLTVRHHLAAVIPADALPPGGLAALSPATPAVGIAWLLGGAALALVSVWLFARRDYP